MTQEILPPFLGSSAAFPKLWVVIPHEVACGLGPPAHTCLLPTRVSEWSHFIRIGWFHRIFHVALDQVWVLTASEVQPSLCVPQKPPRATSGFFEIISSLLSEPEVVFGGFCGPFYSPLEASRLDGWPGMTQK